MQISLPPEVLARVSPEISLQRHLALGLRPCLRDFSEFKPVSITQQEVIRGERIVASNVGHSGNTTLITNISVATVEKQNNESDYGTVWPIVEIHRGRFGEPTDEEMILAQQLHETIYHSKIIPKGALDIELGHQVGEEIIYEQNELLSNKKKYQYVLQAQVQVLSRSGSTSTIFDLIHRSVVQALREMTLPGIYVEESNQISMGGRVTSRNKRGFVAQQTKLCMDHNRPHKVPIGEGGVSSSFGVVDEGILADLEGDAEELGVLSRVSVIAGRNGLKRVSLINGGEKIGLGELRRVLGMAIERASEQAQ